jgi:hypothetical protein
MGGVLLIVMEIEMKMRMHIKIEMQMQMQMQIRIEMEMKMADTPEQAHGGDKSVSMYPPGMQFDLVDEERRGGGREVGKGKGSSTVAFRRVVMLKRDACRGD